MRIILDKYPIALFIEGVIWYELFCPVCFCPGINVLKFGKDAKLPDYGEGD